MCRLVLITFLYLSLTSFIKPSHKSCKVRLFSGYLHSSQIIDQGGLQYKPTWVMAFFLFSLCSLLSFYAVIVFAQNHNHTESRSQIPELFTNTPFSCCLLYACLGQTARSLWWINKREARCNLTKGLPTNQTSSPPTKTKTKPSLPPQIVQVNFHHSNMYIFFSDFGEC